MILGTMRLALDAIIDAGDLDNSCNCYYSELILLFHWTPLGEGGQKKQKKKLTNVSFGLTYIHTP